MVAPVGLDLRLVDPSYMYADSGSSSRLPRLEEADILWFRACFEKGACARCEQSVFSVGFYVWMAVLRMMGEINLQRGTEVLK